MPTKDFVIYEFEKYHQEEGNEFGRNQDYDIFRFIDSPGYSFNEGYEAYSKKIVEYIKSKVKKLLKWNKNVKNNQINNQPYNLNLFKFYIAMRTFR